MVAIHSYQKTSLQDFPGKIAAIVFLAGCNFRCYYCHNPAAVNGKPNVSETEFFSFLESRKGKLQGVVVTGGEPTIHPDLAEFISKIKQMGFLVKLDTNGAKPDFLENLLRQNLVDYVAMDVKAPLNEYKKIVFADVKASALKKSIRLVQNSGVDYEFRTTVHPSMTQKDFDAIAETIKGSKRYFLQEFRDLKTLHPQKHLGTYNKEALLQIQKQFEPLVAEVGVR